jgi:hypothetical protein
LTSLLLALVPNRGERFVNRSKRLPEAGKFPQVIFAAHFINTSLLI